MKSWAMALVIATGLMGAAGVAAGAAGAHSGGGGNLQTASLYLLVHAAAAAAIALNIWRSMLFLASASLLAGGATLFAGDLSLRTLAGAPLFPMAAPGGGMIMIAGWLLLAISGAVHIGQKSSNP